MQQIGQFRDVRRHAASLIAGHECGFTASAGVILKIDKRQRVTGPVFDDEACRAFLDSPGRREWGISHRP